MMSAFRQTYQYKGDIMFTFNFVHVCYTWRYISFLAPLEE